MEAPRWTLTEGVGTFNTGPLAGLCDLAEPSRGVRCQLSGSPQLSAAMLAPQMPALSRPIAAEHELFARGGDLVAIYAASAGYPYRSQIYWRLNSHPQTVEGFSCLAAVEIVASQQTDLLDTQPILPVTSELSLALAGALCLATGELRHLTNASQAEQLHTLSHEQGPQAILLRGSGGPSYAEMRHPLDLGRTDIQTAANGHVKLSHQLFGQHLEKGVILRSRVLGIWLPAQDDVAAALAHFRSFAASEPPLTA